jgi:preprotein translocase subunit SecE
VGWTDRELFEGGFRISDLLGFVVAAGAVLGAYFHPKSHALSIDIAGELMKVTWPTWSETRASTGAVVVASLVAALILFLIDTLAYNLMVEWIPTIWGKL